MRGRLKKEGKSGKIGREGGREWEKGLDRVGEGRRITGD